jgi:hypothetical protein
LRTVTLTTSAPEAAKEVARVITNKIQTAELIPSSFGMSSYGRAFGTAAGVLACAQTTTVVLGAHASVMGMGRIKGDFPGTSAWRPPSC